MKSTLTKLIGVGVLTLSTTVLPLSLPAFAQTTPGTTDNPQTTGTDNTQTTTTDNTRTQDDGFDWGWLGLIGLAGLAGLAGKKREEPTRYRDPNAASTTTYRE